MGLNISKGNMYDFVTHTWNTVKGKCYHDCSYCYMKKWGKQSECHFEEKELKEFDRDIKRFGEGLFIFVGSSNDMFSKDIPDWWIRKTLKHCSKFDNKYLFQTKNPDRILDFIDVPVISDKSVICTTIETDKHYVGPMGNAPSMHDRAFAMSCLPPGIKRYVTIEPIMDFDIYELSYLIKLCNPTQVNIGADSCGNGLSEPLKNKVLYLIAELEKFTVVKQKKNLKRIVG